MCEEGAVRVTPVTWLQLPAVGCEVPEVSQLSAGCSSSVGILLAKY